MHVDDDEAVVIDSDGMTVTNRRGKSLIDNVRWSGAGYLLPMTLPYGEPAPRLLFDAGSIGRGAFIEVNAKRRYHGA
jgi:hypothetical protein